MTGVLAAVRVVVSDALRVLAFGTYCYQARGSRYMRLKFAEVGLLKFVAKGLNIGDSVG